MVFIPYIICCIYYCMLELILSLFCRVLLCEYKTLNHSLFIGIWEVFRLGLLGQVLVYKYRTIFNDTYTQFCW